MYCMLARKYLYQFLFWKLRNTRKFLPLFLQLLICISTTAVGSSVHACMHACPSYEYAGRHACMCVKKTGRGRRWNKIYFFYSSNCEKRGAWSSFRERQNKTQPRLDLSIWRLNGLNWKETWPELHECVDIKCFHFIWFANHKQQIVG